MHLNDVTSPRGRDPRSPRRRVAAALTALALTTSACGSSGDAGTASGSTSSTSPAGSAHDEAALTTSADWLSSQVDDGLVHNDQYDIDDYGLGIDVALALHAVDEQPSTVRAVSNQLEKHVAEYTAPGFGTLVSAGATAKAVTLAEAAGADPASYGGTDLVGQLEATVVDSGPSRGRLQDVLDREEAKAADYANVVGQTYAVQALTRAESPESGAAVDFLLDQQCADGWFRLNFTKDTKATDQTCEGDPTSTPDLDTTAFALQALNGQDAPQATEAVDAAAAWLAEQQAGDGSFGGGSPGAAANSNSTGLAGTALGETGETGVAERAAAWVFEHQALDCQAFEAADVGAIAYDHSALQAAEKKGITPKVADQFRRASAGALPVLQWLPASETVDDTLGSC